MLGGSTNSKDVAKLMAYSQVGMEMVAPIVLGLVLDHYLNWSPWGAVVGVILGLTGGLVHLVQLASKEGSNGPPSKDPPEAK